MNGLAGHPGWTCRSRAQGSLREWAEKLEGEHVNSGLGECVWRGDRAPEAGLGPGAGEMSGS